jgi:aryl-alcohol dehydrogenase-like predicted oxidoreductase
MEQELIILVFNSSIEDEVMEALHAAGMTCYTKVPHAQGVGKESEPRLDSHVWPGTNTMLFICTPRETRERLVGAIREVKERHTEEGVKAIILPVIASI